MNSLVLVLFSCLTVTCLNCAANNQRTQYRHWRAQQQFWRQQQKGQSPKKCLRPLLRPKREVSKRNNQRKAN